MPDAVTSSLSPAQIAPAATPAASRGGGALDKNAFLKLLVAQLKYQNPMSPNDPDQFLAQSAQFTMVEKLEELAKAQTESASWQRLLTGQGLVGRQVTGKDVLGAEVTAVVTGLEVAARGPVLQLQGGQRMELSGVQAVGLPTVTA